MPPPHHDHHHDHHHHPPPPHHAELEKYDDCQWDELPPHLKDAATTLLWDEAMWNADGKAETEDYDWHDLSHEQRKAAEQFGYHPKLWDEGHGHRHAPPHHHHDHHHDHHHHHPHEDHKKEGEGTPDEKKEEDVDADISKLDINDEDVDEAYEEDDKKEESSDTKKQETKKKMFKLSKAFGGDGGDKFDHGNNRSIAKITVYTDGHVVKGLEMGYANTTKKSGSCGGKATTFELAKGEFITSVTVRSNKYIQSIGFKTNKGNELGPVGGKGWTKIDIRGNDTEGEEVKVAAPFKYQLCGMTGRAGSHIDQVAFRWGPVPQSGNKKNSSSK